MFSFKNHLLQEAISYHKKNNIPIYESVFRYGSKGFFALISECKKNLEDFSEEEREYLNTDIGSFGIYEGQEVPLDIPFEELEEEAKVDKVELNKPKRGGAKKFYVYVKNDKGNVIKVQFGDTSGLKAKINDPEARKSFAARHNCAEKNDKTKPGYWACRLPFFSKSLGLNGGGKFFW